MSTTTSSTPAGTDSPEKPFGWRFSTPLLLGSSLNPINSSMIATALVGIGADFHRGPGTTAVLVSVLYLCSAVAQPTMGKLATVLGPRRVYLGGVVILLVGGVIGTTATAFGVLVAARALIGIGTSAAYPTAMALVRRRADALGAGVPSRMLGNLSIAGLVTAAVGLPLGGVLAGLFGWRGIFAVNLPLALVVLVCTLLWVDRDEARGTADGGSLRRSIDPAGIALFAAAVVGLLLFLQGLTEPRWWLAGLVLVAVIALLGWESRAARPLLDVRLLRRDPRLLRTYLRQMFMSLAIYVALYGISQWMEGAAGYTASQAGLILLPLSAVSIVTARVVSRLGWVRWPLAGSGVCLVLTGLVLLPATHHSPLGLLLGMSVLFGTAQGLGGFANQAALYLQSPADQVAVASGLFRTFNYIGAIFSASLIGIAFGGRATDAGLHAVAWVVVGLGLLVLAMTLLDRRLPRLAARPE